MEVFCKFLLFQEDIEFKKKKKEEEAALKAMRDKLKKKQLNF